MQIDTLDVSGILLAKQPLAVSPPGAAWARDDKTAPQRLPSAGATVRYLPASTFRHIIRYGITVVVQSALKSRGKSLSLDALLALDKGFFPQKKSGTDKIKRKPHEILAEEQRIREQNPLLGMLGIWGIPSLLRVTNAVPIANADGVTYTVASGIVRKELEHDLVQTLLETDREQYDALLDQGAESEKEDTGLKHYREKTWEEIVAGTECHWGYQIHRVTPFLSGAVLAALRRFAADPVLGAHRACGRGEVAIRLQARSITHDTLHGPVSTEAGTLELQRGIFTVTGELEKHLHVFDEAAKAGFPSVDFQCLPIGE